ncbi:hypothetical protein KUTeg_012806 [Tegillarca granosa]|uniref:Uncharacterized protein n=1 Tax=Tegillarca granosa TaxID=220873 RepID=A0ABQ9EWS9_TEGGR|nr:hypothetical protein KUTeg_012806 [Tegillarca granosa]
MVLSLHANIHQGCHIFQQFSGVQCTAIALVALLTFMHYMPNLSNLTSEDLDQIIIQGTDLYAFIRGQGRGDDNGYLSHRDLPSRLGDWDNRFSDVQYFYDRYYGPVDTNVALNYDAGQLYFQDAVLDSLQTSSYMLMTFSDNTIAVFHDDSHNVIYLFDSHERNAMGFPDPSGNAILLRFDTLDEFYAYIFTAYRNSFFEITPLHFLWYPNANIMQINTQNTNFNIDTHQTNVCSGTCNPFKVNEMSYGFDHDTLNFHSYCKKTKTTKKKPKRRSRKTGSDSILSQSTENIYFDNSYNYEMNDNGVPFVSTFCSVSEKDCDSSVCKEIDFLKDEKHVLLYEESIRQIPQFHCVCCERILFKDSVCHITQNTTLSNVTYFKCKMYCKLCCSSIQKKTIPYLSCKQNFLSVDEPPLVLQTLTTIEKRLIALIQIFMTLIVLPGGQYAEKGLVLNLPSNVQTIATQLPKSSQNVDILLIRYMHNHNLNVANENLKHFASASKIVSALQWLKQNNKHYVDLIINEMGSLNQSSYMHNISDVMFDLEPFATTPLNSTLPDTNITRKNELDQLDDNCTNIFHSNIIDYYHERPSSLSDMCLFTFCSWYTKCYDPPIRSKEIILKEFILPSLT